MGDGLAVEVAQQSHYSLLQRLANCMQSHEVMAYRKVVPRGPFYELLTIDDHIGLQKVDANVPLALQDTRDKQVFKDTNKAYSQVGLVAHPGKRQRQVTHAVVLGAELDGVQGKASAPRPRVALLMFVTAVVVWKGRCTRKLLQSVLGCWIHICLFRRPVFAVLDRIFHEGGNFHEDEVFNLSAQGRNELIGLMLLAPFIQSDLRAKVCPDVFMLDASPYGAGICRAL